jgi:hypothetical protein
VIHVDASCWQNEGQRIIDRLCFWSTWALSLLLSTWSTHNITVHGEDQALRSRLFSIFAASSTKNGLYVFIQQQTWLTSMQNRYIFRMPHNVYLIIQPHPLTQWRSILDTFKEMFDVQTLRMDSLRFLWHCYCYPVRRIHSDCREWVRKKSPISQVCKILVHPLSSRLPMKSL